MNTSTATAATYKKSHFIIVAWLLFTVFPKHQKPQNAQNYNSKRHVKKIKY